MRSTNVGNEELLVLVKAREEKFPTQLRYTSRTSAYLCGAVPWIAKHILWRE